MNANECAEKAVIVTGAAQGIGRTIAEQFLQQGANVLIFDLDAELAAETALQLAPSGEMVVSVGGDVSRREDVHRAVQTCIERFGRLDVMVAHAGIADATPLLEIDDASWQRIMDVNLTGVFLCTQEAGRVMAQNPDLAGVGGAVPLEDLDGGRLARPVGSEEGKDLTLRHLEVDASHGLDVAVGLPQALDDDGRRIIHRASISSGPLPHEGRLGF